MGHFYNQQGLPTYQVQRSDGKGLRDTTLRDAKKLKLLPSVTTLTSIIAKPGLDNWKNNQILDAVLGYPYNGSITEYQWKGIIISKSQEVGKKAAERGNQLHNRLEKYFINFNFEDCPESDLEFIKPVINELERVFPGVEWIPEKSFGSPLGFGGKIDLISKCEKFIVDFKTKNTDDIEKFTPYYEHLLQLSAYRLGLNYVGAKCYNLYFSTVKPGLSKLHEWTYEELEQGQQAFLHLLEYWKISNKYDSSFTR